MRLESVRCSVVSDTATRLPTPIENEHRQDDHEAELHALEPVRLLRVNAGEAQ